MSCTDLLRTGAAGNVTNKQNWDTGKEQLCIMLVEQRRHRSDCGDKGLQCK